MSIAIICPGRDVTDWVDALQKQAPEVTVEVWPKISALEQVEFVLCWNHPTGVLQQFPNLKCISSLGAGVNHLLDDDQCPTDIPLVRLVDAGLKQSMAEYLLLGALEQFRRLADYRQQQISGEWIAQSIPDISEIRIGIMGLGELGQFVANKLSAIGFKVHGWSRTAKKFGNIGSYSGDDKLTEFLAKTNILICLLPLTPATENILNARTFKQLPADAYLINVARGAHLVETDLLSALDSGHLSGAMLDVFRQEPLPKQHPFWNHEKITVTPHIASVTNPDSAAEQIIENYRRAIKGEELINRVDLQQGY